MSEANPASPPADIVRRYLLRPEFQLANAADVDIPRCVDTVQEAIAILQRQHAEWTAERGESRRDEGRSRPQGQP